MTLVRKKTDFSQNFITSYKQRMKTQSPIFILYVASQERSRKFYCSVLGKEPILDVPGMTEFQISEQAILGLMPEENIVKILGESVPHPSTGNGIPRCEVYLYVDQPEEFQKRAVENGGKLINPYQERTWGDKAVYCSDPDGHIIVFANKI